IPIINGPFTATGLLGTPFTYQIAATQNPVSFGATGLPPGLSVTVAGLIFGTPTLPGSYQVHLSAANSGGTATATLALSITVPPPVANDQSITTAFNAPATITLTATDPNSLPLSYILVGGAAHGSLSTINGSQITYTPTQGYSGTDSFQFKVNNSYVD